VINSFSLKEFGLKIKSLREQKKWTQEDLANETGFHRTYIGMIERAERNISITHIAVFARVFELTVSQLLDFKEINPKHNYKNYETKAEK
jgi:transcriptional regulator with XRE-family HTH domain